MDDCLSATRGPVAGTIDEVYNLVANMGRIGYITTFHDAIARNNILINAHMLEAARQHGVQPFLFSMPKSCAAITGRTTSLRRASCASTTCMVRSVVMTAARRRRQRQFAARWL